MEQTFDLEKIQKTGEQFAQLNTSLLNDASSEFTFRLDFGLQNYTKTRRLSGPVFPVKTHNDILPILQGLKHAPKGAVLLVTDLGPEKLAIAGDIIMYAALYQGLGGVIIDGFIRDVEECVSFDMPILAKGTTMIASKYVSERADEVPSTIEVGSRIIQPGDWIFGDDDGLLIVKKEKLNAIIKMSQIKRIKEEQCKEQLKQGNKLTDIMNLSNFLEGKSSLHIPF